MNAAGGLRGARGALVVLAVVAGLVSPGCTGANACPAPSSTPPAPLGLPPGWDRIRPLLEDGQARAARSDAAGLRALAPELDAEGLSLLKANMPNEVARPDAPRFLEGRTLFGKALLEFARAAESGPDADLLSTFQRLADTWYAWMAALRGLPPERTL